LLLAFHSNYVPATPSCTISDIWRDIARKLTIVTYPTSIWRPVVGDPLEFCRDRWHQKNRVPGLLYGVSVIIHLAGLAVLEQYRRDRQTDGHTTTACTTLA